MVYRIAPNFIPRRVGLVFDCGRTMVSDFIARFTVAQPDVAGTVLGPEDRRL